MKGIISYKDLDNWFEPQAPKKQAYHQYHHYHQDSCLHEMQCLTSFIVAGSPAQDDYYTADDSPERGWYIMLLGNLNNETPALKHVLDSYSYLNSRTQDVRFFMPGFLVTKDGIAASKAMDHREQFEFHDDGFLETIDWLENGNQAYHYSEDMEMVLLPYERNNGKTRYDFERLIQYNLDDIHNEGKNINKFITNAVQVVKKKMTYQETRIQMEGVTSGMRPCPFHKVFIAGSKYLTEERDGIRSAFSNLTNLGNVIYHTWSYEDFRRSFSEEGRQQEYNNFISNEADTIVFILSGEIGETSLSEFNLALEKFKKCGRPNIFVYNRFTDNDELSPEVQKIVDEINRHHQYYIPYSDVYDLKNQIRQDFLLMQIKRNQ